MSYEIIWKPKPLKFLNKLQKEIALRILEKVDNLKKEPFRYLEHYESAKVYKLRIGDYRLLFDINFETKTLIVEVLDKRGRIYK
jgi:mRNA interferase RelE/StbE